ncbi:hypothetical protein SLS62_003455 [Diatrype stigma]|uniref:Exonuclease domain-containing protein n=1 Tax=Diatrype stigma TaxID=117547 RepID=A0AAN9UY68_9PEZI
MKTTTKRKAVVFDCEMAGVAAANNSNSIGKPEEAISLCAIDLLTGETLIHSLIEPQQYRHITDWRTRITGITAAGMRDAAARGEALAGLGAAQAALMEHVDANTVLVGQSLQFDLAALGLGIMPDRISRVVDSAVLAAEAVFGSGEGGTNAGGQESSSSRNENKCTGFPRRWGLKALCREFLGLVIRRPVAGGSGGKTSHDSLEDALATRELVLWCLRNPVELEAWGSWTRAAFDRDMKKEKKEKKQRAKSLRKKQARERRGGRGAGAPGRTRRRSSSPEVERWEDVVDWDVWPKSPPDSD